MDNAHDILNNMVVPHVFGFVLSLPWRLLMLVFPALPPSTASSSSRNRTSPKRASSKAKGGMAARLQHLKMPASDNDRSADRSAGGATDGSPSKRRPRSPPRSPVSPPLPARPRPPASRLRTEKETGENSSGKDERTEVESTSSSPSPASPLGKVDNDGLEDVRETLRLPAFNVSDGAPVNRDHVLKKTSPSSPGQEVTPPREGVRRRLPSSSGRSEGRGSSLRRRSIGEMVRSAITGDFKIRVRDHLFDLRTASPPPPMVLDSKSPDVQSLPASLDQNSGEQNEERNRAPDDVVAEERREAATQGKKLTKPTIDSGSAQPDNALLLQRDGAELGAGSKTETVDSSSLRIKAGTRRRPTEFSHAVLGSDDGSASIDGGGNAAAGGAASNVTARGVVRRKSGAGQTGWETLSQQLGEGGRTNSPLEAVATSAIRGRPTLSSSGNVDTSAAGRHATSDSRAKRLLEWRRRRAEEMENQQRNLARRGRATGVNPSSLVTGSGSTPQSVMGPGDLGSGEGDENVRTTAGTQSKRRFRHVERFRSEMARVPGSSVGAGGETGRPSGSGSARPSSASARAKRVI